MLVFNPNKRYNVNECLAHPYFVDLHNNDEEPICSKVFDWSFDDIELTKENLQNLIYDEAINFHQESSIMK